jgi:gamma-glutamylcyclotransferase (GGCT)/AIG2-like uncharacterized protein YtfP
MAKYAVYGTLRKGFGNNRLLQNSIYLGECKSSPNYKMYSLGGFPGVTKEGNNAITLEVFEVNSELIESNLDMLEGYHKDTPQYNLYNKEKIHTPFGEAFIYIFADKERLQNYPEVKSGDWKIYLNKKN